MLPSGAASTAVTAAHFAVPAGSCPQSRVVRYGCGRSLRGAALRDCASAEAAMLTAAASITSGIRGFMRHSLVSFVVWTQRWPIYGIALIVLTARSGYSSKSRWQGESGCRGSRRPDRDQAPEGV